jgi:type II restriction/modification system DNA methylase subunit YeeA
MNTAKLKKFAQEARSGLMAQVTAKLALVLDDASAARRESPAAVRELEAEIARTSRPLVVEKVAYTWFNRFSALRFMDANGYTNPRIVTPADGQTRPEILAEAAAGHTDDALPEATRTAVTALLDGRTPSRDGQGEAYRLLLVAACNQWHSAMPFLFEKIADYTELLLPDDLLSPSSILAALRAAMTDADCTDVEVIGWLYQFYISEKKDQVFAGLKKNVKITAENIPAATQLFTPHWIVRYLVENSLGRLWMLNRPGSSLHKQLDYYIAPEEAETDFLRIAKPEEIKLCDPACGSGHMLTYAFDLLYAIYEEEGYDPATIPDLILTHNLHGVEIDDRAGALAAFALVMKAAGKRRRFLRAPVQPNICVMQDVSFTASELADCAAVVGRDLYSAELRETLGQFSQAKNFGALIVPRLRDPAEVARVVALKQFEGDLLLRDVQARVMQVLRMAEALSPKYHVVVANPPYMGSGGMNAKLSDFAKRAYLDSKADLFAMFMERALSLTVQSGMMAMINMQSWMFLSSFEKLRRKTLLSCSILTMAHLGARGFDTIGGAVVSTTAFVVGNAKRNSLKGDYLRLLDGRSESEKSEKVRQAAKNSVSSCRFRASSDDFIGIPGSPIAYSATEGVKEAFKSLPSLSSVSEKRLGLCTGDNEKFIRSWQEVDFRRIGFSMSNNEEFQESRNRYAPHNKGGAFRRWSGNQELVIKFDREAFDRLAVSCNRLASRSRYFQPCVTWSEISDIFAVRILPKGFVFNIKGPSIFTDGISLEFVAAYLNSKVFDYLLSMISSTISFNGGDVEKIPVNLALNIQGRTGQLGEEALAISLTDYTEHEETWDFSTLPLLDQGFRQASLAATYAQLRAHRQGMTTRMQELEEENNRIFIQAYGLEGELTPEVPLEEITLTCNPAYRYGGKKTAEELEAALLSDTMREFLSYAVGCMFGRYSLDAPGLILANQGDGLAEYAARVPEPSFAPDADNVIPMLEEDWFPDDVTERFRRFLRVTFGEAAFQDNLAFIEAALGKDIRKYFTRDFFNDHVKRYKKRPIYWLFSSPKGSFNALIYMHRYRPDTVSVVLNDYLREMISKLEGAKGAAERLSGRGSAAEQTKALKEVDRLAKMLIELHAWARDVVLELAQKKVEIDLDDGVKANYPKLGAALKPIKGLEAAEDE